MLKARGIFFIALWCIFINIYPVYSQQYRFYSPFQGLSNTSFNTLYQDNLGYLWIATQKGLNCFDGHNFFEYQHDPLDSLSLDNSSVLSIFQDSKGTIWIGTEYGLQTFDRNTNSFRHISIYFNNSKIFIQIYKILEDNSGILWLATSHGLVSFNTSTNQTVFYHSKYIDNPNTDRFLINTAVWDPNGNLWLGSDKNGLFYFNTQSQTFINFKAEQGKNSICGNSILSLGFDKNKNLVIGTIKNGLSIYNPLKKTFIHIAHNNSPKNLFNGGVYSIATDKNGTTWIGTERNGLKTIDYVHTELTDQNSQINLENIEDSKIHCFVDREDNLWLAVDYVGLYLKKRSSKQFYTINKNNNQKISLSNNIVKSILKDRSGNLWVGTDGGGLNLINPEKSLCKIFQYDPELKNSIPDNAIISLFEDNEENIWIGTYLGGLSLYNKRNQTFNNFLIDPLGKGRDFNYVTSIISDNNNNLWIATNGGGLHHFDTKIKKFTRIPNILINRNTVQLPAFLTSLLLDKNNTLWMGSYTGLYSWNPRKGTYNTFNSGNGSLENEAVNTLFEKNNTIWFGTSSGLYALDKSTLKIKNYSQTEGLPNNSVLGILEDNKENLWISTLNGISKFNVKTGVFRNYFTYDGLPGNEFRPASCYKASDGTLYFGSTFGVVYFNPDSIHEISTFPYLSLTQLNINNTPILIGKKYDNKVILQKSINVTDELTLKFSDKSFSIDFVAIEFDAPEKIKYAFMLENFEKKWNFRDYSQRFANFTNLNPGKYIFKLRCTNSDGIWNENIKTLIIRISPPFYKTWWAYLIYIVIFTSLLFLIRNLSMFRVHMQNKLRYEQLEREKLEELNQSKMQFFSNVSHEFRTPLTLILGPVERLIFANKDNTTLRKQLEFIHRNSLRLLRLVNLLLDLQKVEKNEMKLSAQVGDIVSFTKEIALTFTELANQKKIALTYSCGLEKLEAWFDSDKLDKVLFNLLSNAIKYTSKGGQINVNLEIASNTNISKGECILISVSDTGKGIKDEYIHKIFNRFYQVENQVNDEIQIGTGIGLHLTKFLVELHKGEIKVQSKIGEGTRFDIYLPLGSNHLKTSDIKQNAGNTNSNVIETEITPHLTEEMDNLNEIDVKPVKKGSKKYRILVVEDDFDVRTYIKMELGEFYDILEASDGEEGWSILKDKMPDIVISDVMMPKMNGIQLCKKIKTEINTSHIPVILLTARTSIENRIEGLETGADSYIPKPFHPQHLRIRVEKLIELRQNLIQKFTKNISFEANEVTLTSADEKFLQKAITLVKDNIANTELNIEDMSAELGMSRVHMYRKLKALTNQTPNEFVRTIRLKQAAYYLAQNKINVSEVAYAVGFNSHQYFSNCFQNYFKMSPKEYALQEKNKSNAENKQIGD